MSTPRPAKHVRAGLVAMIAALALIASWSAPAVVAAAGTTTVSVTIDRSTQVGTSQLAVGTTHTQYSVDGSATNPAIARGRALLAAATRYQNQHIYGWGAANPEPSPGVYNWTTLDRRVAMMRAIGGTMVLTLCCAPDWMTVLGTNTSTYPSLPPIPAHVADFAALVKQIALRYPDITHYIVWNEMKGFYDRGANQWDYVAYTRLYNAVYDALKSVNANIQVGGPYLTIEGTGTGTGPWFTADPVDQRNQQVLSYWKTHAHGASFVALDRPIHDFHDNKAYSQANKMSFTPWFGRAASQAASETGLPPWYAEWHFAGGAGGPLNFQAAGDASSLLQQAEGGVAVSLQWEPEYPPTSAGRTSGDNFFTNTAPAGGGMPYPMYYSYRAFNDYFPPGTALYSATSSDPTVEVLASASTTLLVNKNSSSVAVSINGGAPQTLAGYEVRLLDASGHILRYQTATPVITSPASGASEPSSFTVSGGAEPASSVSVSSDGTVVATTTADAVTGLWSVTVSGLSTGSHSLTATATSSLRTQSAASPAVTVTETGAAAATPPGAAVARPAVTRASGARLAPRPQPAGGTGTVTPQAAGATTNPAPAWTTQFGSRYDDRAAGVARDSTGIYVAGGAYGPLPGGVWRGSSDAFLMKLDTNGTRVWTSQFGNIGDEWATGVATDGSGAVYLVGTADQAIYGQTSFGGFDGFIRRYNANGGIVWTREIGTSADDGVTGVAADATGEYVVGQTAGSFPSFTNAGYEDGFLQHYDTSGKLLWTRQFGTSEPDVPLGVAVDATGVTVVGRTAGSLAGTSSGGWDSFVMRYDSSGTLQWTRQWGSAYDDSANGVAADSSGIYVAGSEQAAVDGQPFAGIVDAYVRKYDDSGNLLWDREFGTSSQDEATSVATDAAGGVAVAGLTAGALAGTNAGSTDAFVSRFDTNGSTLWTAQIGGASADEADAVTTGGGHVDIAGVTNGTMPGGTSAGGKDAFVTDWLGG